MGGGTWTKCAYKAYATTARADVFDSAGDLKAGVTAQQYFTKNNISPKLDAKNVTRECVDSEEHPNTFPVILALDVTGSMGSTAVEIARKLNSIMESVFKDVPDIEFCVMAIGDLAYDEAPIQISQFESDIRIVESLDEVYFEGGGGGNKWESYTAAWWMGLYKTKLDCLKRGKKGLIITIGDETINPYLPSKALSRITGDAVQADVDTAPLFAEASQKFDIQHVHVKHSGTSKYRDLRDWKSTIGAENVSEISSIGELKPTLERIIKSNYKKQYSENVVQTVSDTPPVNTNENGEIVW